jgi:transposase
MLSFCGIDVSKDRLDVMVLPEEQCCSVPNDAGGWAALLERLRNFSIAAIGLEASGGYERGIARALLAAGISVRHVQAAAVREGERGSGEKRSTHARMIASFVGIMPTATGASWPEKNIERLSRSFFRFSRSSRHLFAPAID